uniref:Uncharacterized protein n=1 Tax=Nostoc flagelliforme str. Sunitezuoqi TaxID=676037 RepID=E7DPU0_9NOSO|nr:hypothetical protein Nfla_4402 [Nostoc flagelliforme str. Sunitezuoqi]
MSRITRPHQLRLRPCCAGPKSPYPLPKGEDWALRHRADGSGDRRLVGIAQYIAAAPNGLDVVVALGRHAELLAQLADEDVDDLELRLVHSAIEVVEEHFLGERRALAEREQLQHRIFLARQVHAGIVDLDRLGVEIDCELAGADDRLAVPLGAAHDGVDARDQLLAVERLGDIIVRAEAEAAYLRVHLADAGQDQHRCRHAGDAQLLQHVIAVHVRQVEVEQDDVVIVELAEVQALFAQVRRVDVEAFGGQHQLDRLGGRRFVLDQQHAHRIIPLSPVAAP